MSKSPRSQQDQDDIEVMSILITRWENENAQIDPPTAIEALRFRMEQQGLQPRDLEPFLGTRARISQVLSGARPLSLEMIRSLNKHLGISADVLIRETERRQNIVQPSAAAISMLKSKGHMKANETFKSFFARAVGVADTHALMRKTLTDRANTRTDHGAMQGWCAAVLIEAEQQVLPSIGGKRPIPLVSQSRRLAKLSAKRDALEQVRGALNKIGVVFIVLEHFPGTYLDGAAMRRVSDGAPIIALTLRHDRLDNFWFTLLHEYIHVCKHLKRGLSLIIDDLDIRSADEKEDEADAGARSALVPDEIWHNNNRPDLDYADVERIAAEAEVHPAVVAGRWQFENKNYKRFSRFLGRGEVRSVLMPD